MRDKKTNLRAIVGFALVLMAGLPSTTAAQQAVVSDSTTVVGPQPGDLVQVRIWREPDLSGDFQVSQAGSVFLPLLGSVNVLGKTSEGLIAELTDAYLAYLRNPTIQIAVLRRIAVQGEVRNPGLYPVDATVSVADALALAGGLTPNANSGNIKLVRQGQVLAVDIAPTTVIQRSPVLSGDQIWVGQKSWLARNSGILVGAGISAAALIAATLITR